MSALLGKTLRSSTFKLALASIAIFGAVVVALFGYVYASTASYVRSRSDQTIATEFAILQRTYTSAGRDGLIAAIERRLADQGVAGDDYLLVDLSFVPLAGNLPEWPSALKDASGWGTFAVRKGQSRLRARYQMLSDGSRLLMGRDIDDLDAFAQKIKIALSLGLVLIFALAGVASLSVTRRTVGRIEAINATSRAIMHSGLGRRIPLRGTRDEWDDLAASLNSMLDRIEALMAEVKQVTENVAHDLRTPLARMRGRLEKAHSRRRDVDSDQALISDTLADLEDVLRLFSSLMRISQIEANDRTAGFGLVNLAIVAHEVVELFDAAAEEKGIHIELTADRSMLVMGDRDLLFEAISNLVDNSIKYGRAGGRVTVELDGTEDDTILAVADNGPGIPADECQHVFKRFYRLEQSRRTPGNGLGLSLVDAVARLHGARIEMRDNDPGLHLQLSFPTPVPSSDVLDTLSPTQANLARRDVV